MTNKYYQPLIIRRGEENNKESSNNNMKKKKIWKSCFGEEERNGKGKETEESRNSAEAEAQVCAGTPGRTRARQSVPCMPTDCKLSWLGDWRLWRLPVRKLMNVFGMVD